jgi:HPt (histidine-containing phosphotransfer) domain-containing protein
MSKFQKTGLLGTLNETAVFFLSQREKSLDDMLTTGIMPVVDSVGIDKLIIWRKIKKPEGLSISQIYRWSRRAGGTTRPISILIDFIFSAKATGWEKFFKDGKIVNSPVRELPEDDVVADFKKMGILSAFVAPVFINDDLWGFVLFGDCDNERRFDPDSADLMSSAAHLYANAIIRAEMENAIKSLSGMDREINLPAEKPEAEKPKAKKPEAENSDSAKKDEELQTKLQTSFVKDNQDTFNQISEAITAGDKKRAFRLAHTLKNGAELIGKAKLQNVAAVVEDLLKNDEPQKVKPHMDILKKELTLVLEELAPLLKAKKTARKLSAKQALALLEQLEPLLKNRNPQCADFVDDIHRIPGAEELASQINEYNFKKAIKTLAELKEK